MIAGPIVYVVDDDPLILDVVRDLLSSTGIEVESHTSGRSFLGSFNPYRAGCLVLDVRMPDLNGLEVQDRLVQEGVRLPIIFLTGYGDVTVCARAFRNGAFDFLLKPPDYSLARLVLDALKREFERRRLEAWRANGPHPSLSLTTREREVMAFILSGKTLKQIAAELGITVQTAAKHRARVLQKHGVETDVALVRLFLAPPEAEPV